MSKTSYYLGGCNILERNTASKADYHSRNLWTRGKDSLCVLRMRVRPAAAGNEAQSCAGCQDV
jgi:hypothetical protein